MNLHIKLSLLFQALVTLLFTQEVDYQHCSSIQEAIFRETNAIENTSADAYEQLAELLVRRGESHLIEGTYQEAVNDFNNANTLLGYFNDINDMLVIAFRIEFGKSISYDNLNLSEKAAEALEQLQMIVDQMICIDCLENHPCQKSALSFNQVHSSQSLVRLCKHKNEEQRHQKPQENYDDILGPDPLPPNWCLEVVTGTGRSMEVIALLAPNHAIKAALIGIIEALTQRAIKCCHTGNFWKACVAPICRKWKEWDSFKREKFLPNDKNLPLYITDK